MHNHVHTNVCILSARLLPDVTSPAPESRAFTSKSLPRLTELSSSAGV